MTRFRPGDRVSIEVGHTAAEGVVKRVEGSKVTVVVGAGKTQQRFVRRAVFVTKLKKTGDM